MALISFACVSTLKASNPDWRPDQTNLSLQHNISSRDKDQVKSEQPYQRESPSWVEDVKSHPILFTLAPLLVTLAMIIGIAINIIGEVNPDNLYVPPGLVLVATILPALLWAAIPSLWQVKKEGSTQERTYTPPFSTRFWRSFRFLASSAWTFVPWLTLVVMNYKLPFFK